MPPITWKSQELAEDKATLSRVTPAGTHGVVTSPSPLLLGPRHLLLRADAGALLLLPGEQQRRHPPDPEPGERRPVPHQNQPQVHVPRRPHHFRLPVSASGPSIPSPLPPGAGQEPERVPPVPSMDESEDMHSLLLTDNSTLLVAGLQNHVLEIDLNTVQETQKVRPGRGGCSLELFALGSVPAHPRSSRLLPSTPWRCPASPS